MSGEIKFYDRADECEKIEKVYGEWGIKFLYTTSLGGVVRGILKRPFFSRLYGFFQNTPASRRKIKPFIKKFHINMNEYDFGHLSSELKEESYFHFNDFFIRKFLKGKRPFLGNDDLMPAFCEARYFGWESVNEKITFPVKGVFLNASSLLGSLKKDWGAIFTNGPLLLARLCPVDYHRFHFPDTGEVLATSCEGDELESVNPLALKAKPEIFLKNERKITILQTENFGKLAYIEVGATCVGSIIHSHKKEKFKRGEEKGYFLFGGSTVIVLGEKGKWKPASDILERTSKDQEVLIRLGREVGNKNF